MVYTVSGDKTTSFWPFRAKTTSFYAFYFFFFTFCIYQNEVILD